MTRRIGVLIALLAVLAIPSVAKADTVVLSDWTTGDFATNAGGGGGPFRATTTGPLLGSTSFVTFCLEYTEHFSYGNTYNFTLSDSAMNGGTEVPSDGLPGDLVDSATKWIYFQVVTGGYTSFASYFGTGVGVGARVQEAIWLLEDERTSGQVTSGAAGLAAFALTQDWAALEAQGHRVVAMNLTTANGGLVQDQLAYFSVPEPGSLLLLGLGLFGMAALIRRRHA